MPLSGLALLLLAGPVSVARVPQLWPAAGDVPLEAYLYVQGLQDVVVTDETGAAVRFERAAPDALVLHATRDGQRLHLELRDALRRPAFERTADYVARADWSAPPWAAGEPPVPRVRSASLNFWLEVSVPTLDRPWVVDAAGLGRFVSLGKPVELWPRAAGFSARQPTHLSFRPWALDGRPAPRPRYELDVVMPWSATVHPWPLAVLQAVPGGAGVAVLAVVFAALVLAFRRRR